jgi:hypothetical protein
MSDKGKGIVRIGDQDKKIFMMLLEQGCLTIEMIYRFFAPSALRLPKGRRHKLYFRLNRLSNAEYIKKERICGRYLYSLTEKGVTAVKDLNRQNLTAVTALDPETVKHDLICVRMRHHLESRGAIKWVSDRVFRTVTDQVRQIPDGACYYQDNSVFLEVELSQKSKERYDKIVEVYDQKKGPQKVLYIYDNPKVVEYLIDVTRKSAKFGYFQFCDSLDDMGPVMGTAGGVQISFQEFLSQKEGGQ